MLAAYSYLHPSIFNQQYYVRIGLISPLYQSSQWIRQHEEQYQLSSYKILHSPHTATINDIVCEKIEHRYLLSADQHGHISCYDIRPDRTATGEKYDRQPLYTATSIIPTTLRTTTSSIPPRLSSINTICWYPADTGMFITGGNDQYVHCWDTNTFSIIHSFHLQHIVYQAMMPNIRYPLSSSISSHHSLIAVASNDTNIRLCDMISGAFSHTLIGHRDEVTSVCWSPYNPYILCSGSADKSIRIWDIRRAGHIMLLDMDNNYETANINTRYLPTQHMRSQRRDIIAHTAPISHIAYTNDGLYIVSLGCDHRIRIWNTSNGLNTMIHISLANKVVRSHRFIISSSDRHLWCGEDKLLCQIRIADGHIVQRYNGHFDRIHCVTNNQNTDDIYSAGEDHSILVWSQRYRESQPLPEIGELEGRGEAGEAADSPGSDNDDDNEDNHIAVRPGLDEDTWSEDEG